MNFLCLALIIAILASEIIAIIYRARRKRTLATWLDILTISLFVVFAILRFGLSISLNTIDGWINLSIVLFAISLLVARIWSFASR